MSKLIFIQPTSHSSEQQHTKVWAFFVELQIMTMCESAPGLGKVGCLPFLANPWEYFYLFRLHCPPAQILSGSHSWVENGASWQESMHKKCKEQVLLNVKLKRTICPMPGHPRKWWNLCFETFLLQTQAMSVKPWGLVPCQGWLCLCCWQGTATGSLSCNSAK